MTASAHNHNWQHTNQGILGTSLWTCSCGAECDGSSIKLDKPVYVETAGLWFFTYAVHDPTHAFDDENNRHLVRGWFHNGKGGAAEDARRAIAKAKEGGFYVDSFRDPDDGDWALVIDASKVPADALPNHLRS